MLKIISIFLIALTLSACATAPLNTPSAEPLKTPTSPAKAECSSPTTWTIQYSRSGGFAGLNQSLTLDSNGSLMVRSENPPADETKTVSDARLKTVSNLLVQACPFKTEPSKGGACADCFSYGLTIQMDGQMYVTNASDTTLTEDLHPLITALNEFFPTAGK